MNIENDVIWNGKGWYRVTFDGKALRTVRSHKTKFHFKHSEYRLLMINNHPTFFYLTRRPGKWESSRHWSGWALWGYFNKDGSY